jgi:glycosyltransferase involved in cell wall biosynthesis
MKLLYVTAEVPWPLSSGYLRHFHLLRGLAESHDITQLSLTRRVAVPDDARPALAPFVRRLEVFGEGRSGGGSLGKSLHLRRAAGELRRAVARELATGEYDAVVLSGKDTFPAMAMVGDTPLVIDVCDAASLRLAGELDVAKGLRRRVLLRARLIEMRRIERRLIGATPHLLFASERDRTAVGATEGVIVSNGVDLDLWTRREAGGSGSGRSGIGGSDLIAFSGAMAYRPNDDAALRLVERILPRVREQVADAQVVLAGRDPLPGLLAAADNRAEVTVTGTVDDLRPYLEDAAVYCAPLRFAAGIQNKLLEALAMELPVVTTPIAAAGLIAGEHPAPLVVAEDDASIADAIVALLRDPAERTRLAEAGRRHVEDHFSWPASVARVDEVLRRAAGRPAAALATVGAPALDGGER